MLGATIRSAPLAPVAVPDDRCIACHDQVLEQLVEANGLRMSHLEPFEAGVACVDCHGRVAHGAETPEQAGLAMEECLRCHVVSPAYGDCDTCHTESVSREERIVTGSFAATHGESWKTMHGMGDIRTCVSCHTAARCQGCHDVPLPHGMMWMSEHGPASSRSDCTQCHDRETFCDGCHGLPMPHPADFLGGHSKYVMEAGGKTEHCQTCHDERACKLCHARHTHPGLDPERARRLRAKAGLDE
jgi:hypothetical protein